MASRLTGWKKSVTNSIASDQVPSYRRSLARQSRRATQPGTQIDDATRAAAESRPPWPCPLTPYLFDDNPRPAEFLDAAKRSLRIALPL
jgi:hypothetical protein